MLNIKNLKIRTKLFLSFFLIVLIIIIANVFVISSAYKVTNSAKTASQKYSQMVFLIETERDIGKTVGLINTSIGAGTKEAVSDAEAFHEIFVQKLKNSTLEFSHLPDFLNECQKISALYEEMFKNGKDWAHYNIAQEWAKIKAPKDAFHRLAQKLQNKISKLKISSMEETNENLQGISQSSSFLISLNLMATLISIILSFVIAFFLTKVIAVPVKRAALIMKDIAEGEGDLTKRMAIDSKDEIGELSAAFNKFIGNLMKIIKSVKKTSEQLTNAISEISSTSQQISDGAQ